MRPHLSISQPHLSQVQPPQSACLTDLGNRTFGAEDPHEGQLTRSRLIPQRVFVAVPITTNTAPTSNTEATTTNSTFTSRSGIRLAMRMSKTEPSARLTRMAFPNFMRYSRVIMLHKARQFEPSLLITGIMTSNPEYATNVVGLGRVEFLSKNFEN
jgi:hypothetical protein